MQKGPDIEDVREILSRANKIINVWVKKELPYTNTNLLEEKYKDYAKEEKEKDERELNLARFKEDEKEKTFFENSANKLGQQAIQHKHQNNGPTNSMNGWEYVTKTMHAINTNPKLTDKEKLQQLTALQRHMDGLKKKLESKEKSIIPQVDKTVTNEFPLASYDMYQLYLYIEQDEANDHNDLNMDNVNVCHEQSTILKKIKKLIKEISVENIDELFKIDILLLKIISILNYSQFEVQQNLNFSALEHWGKIGLWLIERCAQPIKKWEKAAFNKFSQHVEKVTRPLTALIYANIAYHLANSNKPEKAFAENFLEIAKKLSEKFVHIPQTLDTVKLIDSLCKCTEAKLAWDKNQIALSVQFMDDAQKIGAGYTSSLFSMLYIVGKHYSELEPDLAMHYFEKAQALTKKASGREMSLEQARCNEMQHSILLFKKKILTELKIAINIAFPTARIKILPHTLNIFIPLPEVPCHDILLSSKSVIGSLIKRHNFAFKEENLTGFQFCTLSDNPTSIISAIHHLIKMATQKEVVSVKPQSVVPEYIMVNPLKPAFTQTPSEEKEGFNHATESLLSSPLKIKKKTRGPSQNSHSSPNAVQKCSAVIQPKKRFAKDYGFTLCETNERATPIYFSETHKKSGNTEIIVCGDAATCNGLDQITIKKFNSLFHPDGVVQAREVNDSGFKIIHEPNKDRWIIRAKLKGVGGSTRLYFAPKESIETENGVKTLYRLKKKINK